MQHNTAVGFAYLLLSKGIHLREIQRFVDASTPPIDPKAETIPAPPPSKDGREDQDVAQTIPAPPLSLLDFRDSSEVFWNEVAEVVEIAGRERGLP